MKKSLRKECFCAHCRSPRKLRYHRRLQGAHYFQIVVLTIGLSAVLYPLLDFKGLMSFPIVWAIFDLTYKTLYRKDLKCPFCGFDPTWYKKDVRIARRQVEDFLKQNPESPVLQRARKMEDFQNSQTTLN
jgi:hypothetical protein